MRRLLVLLAVVALFVMGLAMPAIADRPSQTGDKISVYDEQGPNSYPESEYPANTAFHVEHGFGFGDDDPYSPHRAYYFKLLLNGELLEPDFVNRGYDVENDWVCWLWVYNFADGLDAGEYELEGIWYARCKDVREDCTNKDAGLVEWSDTLTLTIYP